MTIKEYFDNLPVDEVVNKRGLAYLKRLGMIYDYSPWGYLESLHIFGKKQEGSPWRDDLFLKISPKQKCKGAENLDYGEMSFEDMLDYFGCQGKIEFNGNEFSPRYFDGCFKPYLVKTGPKNGLEVDHRMSVWGRII